MYIIFLFRSPDTFFASREYLSMNEAMEIIAKCSKAMPSQQALVPSLLSSVQIASVGAKAATSCELDIG